jgi:uncharacterized protein YchJ
VKTGIIGSDFGMTAALMLLANAERRKKAGLLPKVEPVKRYVKPALKGNKRNQPCPCGSGLKYKKCCLLKERED